MIVGVYYLRFMLQLILMESIFLVHEKRRKYFFLRLLGAFAILFGALYLASHFWLFLRNASVPIPIYTIRSMINFTFMFASTLAVIPLCFKVMLADVMFAGSGGYALQHATNCAMVVVIYFMGGFDLSTPSGVALDYIFFRVLPYIAVAVCVYWLVVRPRWKRSELENKNLKIIIFSFVIFFSSIILNELAGYLPEGTQYNSFTSGFVCKIYSILCCITSLMMQFSIFKTSKAENDKYLQNRLFEMQKAQYSISKETIDQVNIKFHDMKHILASLDLEENSEQKKKINKIKKEVTSFGFVAETGNSALDAVLMQKFISCQNSDIRLICATDGTALNFMDDIEIYVLFANILDNAINAACEMDEEHRSIELTVGFSSGVSVIHCENYCAGKVNFVDGLPVTGRDKQNHGFGTKSILQIVRKYGGDLRMSQEDNVFKTGITFLAQ